jgi:hypothetical protein
MLDIAIFGAASRETRTESETIAYLFWRFTSL